MQPRSTSGAVFCDGCGQQLGLGCVTCGHELREGARFCDACGAPTPLAGAPATARPPFAASRPVPVAAAPRRRRSDLLADPVQDPEDAPRRRSSDPAAAVPHPGRRRSGEGAVPPVRLPAAALGLLAAEKEQAPGERKQVTVLFADVEGSMDLSEGMDPERWREIMASFFEVFCAVVEKYEGTVHQFVGDGAIAYFGAPIAHEDHARRACVAALELGEKLRRLGHELRESEAIGFHMRMGLNSGDVVVGAMGADQHSEYVAIGHTVGLSERMQAIADPDTACISENTAALVRGTMRLRDRGAFEVKGVREPMRIFELVGLRGHHDAEGDRAMPLVGRLVELAVLDASLRRAAGGDGQAVALIGEAGIGKRRLVSEFAGRAKELGLETIAIEALAHERNVPLLTFSAIVHAFFGIDPAAEAAARREGIGAAFLALDPGAAGELPLLLDLLGLGDGHAELDATSPEGHRRRVARLLGRLLRARTQEEPLLVVVQNLQWLDAASAERMADLVNAISGARVLLILSYRPEYRPRWSAEVTTVRLAPLNEAEQHQLLEDVLGTDASLGDLPHRIAARAAGNPLFLVEMVRTLTDSGALSGQSGSHVLTRLLEDAAIPPTVEALVAARIDRLPEREKAVLQAAAVVGEEFDDDVLQRVTRLSRLDLDGALDALEANDLMRPVDGGHAFRQTVVQEVAYRQQLERRRKQLHAAAAAALADVDGELGPEHLALIAAHAERAGDHVPAAEWHAQAARASEEEPIREREHWRDVRRLLSDAEESDEWLERLALAACVRLLTLGWRLSDVPEDELELHREARALAERTHSAAELVAALVGHGVRLGLTGELEQCLALTAEAADAAQRAQDEAGEAVATWMALPLSKLGRLEEAHRQLSRGVQLCEREPTLGRGVVVESQYAWCHHHRSIVNAWMGKLGAAVADGELGVALAEEHGDRRVACWSRLGLALVHGMGGELALAQEHLEAGSALADALDEPLTTTSVLTQRALLLVAAGRAGDGLLAAEASCRLITESALGSPWRSEALVALAAARLGTGDGEGAVEAGHAAVAAARGCGATADEIPALLTLGHALVAQGDGVTVTAARAAVDRGLALVRASGALAFSPALHALCGTVCDLEGDAAGAARAQVRSTEALEGTRLIARPVWRGAPLGPAPGPGSRRLRRAA